MGKSYTSKYMVRLHDQRGATEMAWCCKTHGRPSDDNAETFRQKMNESVQPGGVNAHLADDHFGVPHFSRVYIRINKRDGDVVAEALAPMFEVV